VQKKIAYIATSYAVQHDGISVYLENVLYELVQYESIEIDVFVRGRVKDKLQDRIVDGNTIHADINYVSLPGFLPHMIISVNYLVNKSKYDLVISPNLTPLVSFANRSCTVIHDVTYKVYPGSLSWLKRMYKGVLFWTINFDDYFGYISNATLLQINKYTNIPNRIPGFIVSNGIPVQTKIHKENFLSNGHIVKSMSVVKFIFVGSLNYHKGLDVALKFVSSFVGKIDQPVVFDVIGKETSQSSGILKQYLGVTTFKLNVRGYVSDEELYQLYSEAHYTIFFSQSEGFGIPVVESLYFDSAPLLSDIPVFRELTDNSIEYYSHQSENLDEFIEYFLCIFHERDRYVTGLKDICRKYFDGYKDSAKSIYQLSCGEIL